MGLYRLSSISISSSQVARTERPVSLLDHKGCPQTLLCDKGLRRQRASKCSKGVQSCLHTGKKIQRAKTLRGRADRTEEKNTTFLGHLPQCSSVLMGKVFSIYPIRVFSCTLWEWPPTLLWRTSYKSLIHPLTTLGAGLLPVCWYPSWLWGGSAGHKITDGVSQMPSRRGKTHFPPLLDSMLFVIQPSMQLAFVATRLHCWFPFNLSSTRTPRSFCRAAAPVHPQPVLRHRVIFSQMQGFALVSVELWEASCVPSVWGPSKWQQPCPPAYQSLPSPFSFVHKLDDTLYPVT